MNEINDVNVEAMRALPTPNQLKQELPMTPEAARTVIHGRTEIVRMLSGDDDRLLMIVGPCSIHDPEAALEYAERLVKLRQEMSKDLAIIMRLYFEKPRTTVGWKGLIYDPRLDGSDRIDEGLRLGRRLLLQINELGMPCASEFLDPVIPQYSAELVSWAAIGARTTESQTHREMCSGLSMPVGFKNGTDGNLQIAVDAMISAQHAHTFVGVDGDGMTSLVRTRGNPCSHIVLRGGRDRPNYDEVSIMETIEALKAAGQRQHIVVDCSHGNSSKRPERQLLVCRSVLGQRLRGTKSIMGVMLESNLCGGTQKMTVNGEGLQHGVSITDDCINWEDTEELIRDCVNQIRNCSGGTDSASVAC